MDTGGDDLGCFPVVVLIFAGILPLATAAYYIKEKLFSDDGRSGYMTPREACIERSIQRCTDLGESQRNYDVDGCMSSIDRICSRYSDAYDNPFRHRE